MDRRSIKGYELRERVGAGGFGEVYRAYQPSVGREVAIKVILPQHANQPDFVRRFEVEAQLVARLEHPHIVPLYDYWRDPEGAYLVMRWLPKSLRSAIEHGPWSPPAIARLLDQITAALTVAHRENVVHRDIKPDNILLDEDENAYLADFGIAKDLNLRDLNITGEDAIAGSPAYLSPEQIKGDPLNSRTDIYSLGLVIYEMLVGEKPFPDATTPYDFFNRHLNTPLPLMSPKRAHLPAALDEVLQTATAKDPAYRYANALRFASAFRAALPAVGPRLVGQPLADPLTSREIEVLRLIVSGLTNEQISEKLFLSAGTVKWYVKEIYSKLDVHSRQQAIERAQHLQLLEGLTLRAVANALPDVLADVPTVVGQEIAIPAQEPVNPYKGLRAFQEADAPDFFGRAALVEQLLNRLSEKDDGARFLAVVGPSGSGKSSVVKAGLLPALRQGALTASPCPFIAEMLPGTHPLEELEAALLRVSVNPIPNLMEQLNQDRRGLVRAAKRVLPNNSETELVLVIDQFEELFTLVESEETRAHFIANLLSAASDPRGRVRIIVTLRADFYDRPLLYPRLAELIRGNTEVVVPLTPRELEQAIVGPAERAGLHLEAGLVSTVVNQVSEQPGMLPLLQYALTELYEKREGVTLTLSAFDASGGVLEALARRADELYNGLDSASQAAARQIFLRLVTLGEGVEDTRRRALQSELLSIGQPSALVEEVLNAFSQYRLLTLDRDPLTRGPTVEVAHEALLRQWDRLREWLNDNREDIRLQRALGNSAGEWEKANRETSYLLGGTRLAQAEEWSKSTRLALTQGERAYLDASIAERTRQQIAEQARAAHEAALERRSKTFLRILVLVLAFAALGGIGLSVFALDREHLAQDARAASEANLTRAEREAAVSHSLVLANSAVAVNESGNTELGLSLAVEAVKIPDPPSDAEIALRNVAQGPGSRAVLRGHTNAAQTVAFSPDSHLGLSGSCAQLDGQKCSMGEIILWDLQAKAELHRMTGHSNAVTSVVFTPNGQQALSAGSDGTIISWDVNPASATFGMALRQYSPGLGSVNQIVLGPTDQTLLAATGDGLVILLDLETGSILRHFEGHTGSVNTVALSPDGQTMLSGGEDGLALLWDIQTGEIRQRFEGHSNAVVRVAFNPIEATMLSANSDATIRLWDTGTGTELQRMNTPTEIHGLAIGPDGREAMIDYGGGAMFLLDIAQWRTVQYLLNIPEGDLALGFPIFALTIDASGSFALTGSGDGSVTLWNLGLNHEVRRYPDPGSPDGFTSMSLRPDGRRLLVGETSGGEALLWDVDPESPTYGTVIAHLPGYQGMGWIIPAIFSPDGRYALIGSADYFGGTGAKSLILWDTDEASPTFATPLRHFEGLGYYPRSIAFTPDSRQVLVGTSDLAGNGELLLWDVTTGSLLQKFDTNIAISSILFTPDGRRALTTSSYYRGVVEWDTDPASPTFGTQIRQFETRATAYGLSWGPQGMTFFVADGYARLEERDYQTGQVIRQFQGGSTSGLWTAVVSPDGRYVMTGDDPGQVVLWDYQTGSELWRADRQDSAVPFVAFSPDSQKAFSLRFSGVPVEWKIQEPSLSELLSWIPQNRYLRELTCDERAQYDVKPLCDENSAPSASS